jgi:hypothetical protein
MHVELQDGLSLTYLDLRSLTQRKLVSTRTVFEAYVLGAREVPIAKLLTNKYNR